MVGQHHRVNGHEFEQTPGGGEVQGSQMCCGPWGRKETDMTEGLNNCHHCLCGAASMKPLSRDPRAAAQGKARRDAEQGFQRQERRTSGEDESLFAPIALTTGMRWARGRFGDELNKTVKSNIFGTF